VVNKVGTFGEDSLGAAPLAGVPAAQHPSPPPNHPRSASAPLMDVASLLGRSAARERIRESQTYGATPPSEPKADRHTSPASSACGGTDGAE